ncbi:Kef-type potassium/proton antiporter, CPA2 family (TC 2.A.37.1) [Chelatococcus sambhunathii]|uniref:Kef-type potassium/proton antiporter, CPA2 family (TC 2.A.37.1) n=2 Tax=Chelatococcus sambhunathii TaxID=363953 RepID=A0ABP1ZYB5_9HYPH|nr:Kef-type potassium/proton antiporter, CPA2 family (TC 2.A.37.1) [Chelatococcus sambhunathii]
MRILRRGAHGRAMTATVPVETYKDALLVLAAAGAAVPMVKLLRISPVLGFLGVGAVLGPHGLGNLVGEVPVLRYLTISDQELMARIAEFGVVFLLFVIGIELSWARLWTLRRLVFGLGFAQVVTCGAALGLGVALAGGAAAEALVIGSALALSSTAIVLESLAERRRLGTSAGRTSFAVLLFQDLAVVPLLFLVGVLGAREEGSVATGFVIAIGQAVFAIAVIVLIGRRALRPFFRLVAAADSPELFMAAALLVVVGTALATGAAGLSMPLGAFIAGLLLAETEYRREIEVMIAPFKGLLLGVFFISVGMMVDIGGIARQPGVIVGAAAAAVVVKTLIVYGLVRLFSGGHAVATESALLLGPGGEFAFVLLTHAAALAVVPRPVSDIAIAATAVTMVFIPLLARLGAIAAGRFDRPGALPPEAQMQPEPGEHGHAIVIGCGRVGRLVSDMLSAQAIDHLVVDRDVATVTAERRHGRNVFYGDATRREYLRLCGIADAAGLIITVDASTAVDEIVRQAKALTPGIKILARARDARHARHLYGLGVTHAVPETIEASLQLSEASLVHLGVPMGLAIAAVHDRRDLFRNELRAMREAREP